MCQRVTLPRLICSRSLNDSARGAAEQITPQLAHLDEEALAHPAPELDSGDGRLTT